MTQRPAGHIGGCGCPICSRIDRNNPPEGRRPNPEPIFDPEEDELGQEAQPRGWVRDALPAHEVHVDMGRGQTVPVTVGVPFAATLDRLAEEAHYGGFFRVFLNGSEVINREDAPANIEAGMRIAVTAYDKVG